MTKKYYTDSFESIIFSIFVIEKFIWQINSQFLHDRACSKFNNWSNSHLNNINISHMSWRIQIRIALICRMNFLNLFLSFSLFLLVALFLSPIDFVFGYFYLNLLDGVDQLLLFIYSVLCCVLFYISYLISYFWMQVYHMLLAIQIDLLPYHSISSHCSLMLFSSGIRFSEPFGIALMKKV